MIYLDYQATTPLAPEAREAMLRWLGGPESDTFGNPHSPHRMGRMAAAAVERALHLEFRGLQQLRIRQALFVALAGEGGDRCAAFGEAGIAP